MFVASCHHVELALLRRDAITAADRASTFTVELARTDFDSQSERGADYDLSKVQVIGTTTFMFLCAVRPALR